MSEIIRAEIDAAKAEFYRQWAICGMPKDKQRLADAAWCSAAIATREAAAKIVLTGEFCVHSQHMQMACDCDDIAKAIRDRT